jgi:hypothetical protein
LILMLLIMQPNILEKWLLECCVQFLFPFSKPLVSNQYYKCIAVFPFSLLCPLLQ